MSRDTAAELLRFLEDSLAGVEEAVKSARREAKALRTDLDNTHPDVPERLVFPVLDRAQTAQGAAERLRAELERGGR